MKQERMIIIRPDDTQEIVIRTSVFPLAELQKYVGGYIQLVPEFNRYDERPCLAYCDEEGRLKGLPFNKLASLLWRKQLDKKIRTRGHIAPGYDLIHGNLVIIQREEAQ